MSAVITKATYDDLDALSEMFDSYRKFYGQPRDLDAAQDFLKTRMERDEILSFIATYDGTPAGFTNIYPSFSSVSMRPLWVLNDLFVKPDFRRQGLGDDLLVYAHTQAKANGVVSMQLETAADNIPAQNCYERGGWQKNEFLSYYINVEGTSS